MDATFSRTSSEVEFGSIGISQYFVIFVTDDIPRLYVKLSRVLYMQDLPANALSLTGAVTGHCFFENNEKVFPAHVKLEVKF